MDWLLIDQLGQKVGITLSDLTWLFPYVTGKETIEKAKFLLCFMNVVEKRDG